MSIVFTALPHHENRMRTTIMTIVMGWDKFAAVVTGWMK
jgi:hypothetical protein